MGISDRIESFITELLKDEDNWVEIGRNELASIFNCVPSQINYVISTRFSPERGYIVESRRGGGGCLKIKRINADDTVGQIISLITNEIDFADANALLLTLYRQGKIGEHEINIIRSAISDKSLSPAGAYKNSVRASILKNMILAITQ